MKLLEEPSAVIQSVNCWKGLSPGACTCWWIYRGTIVGKSNSACKPVVGSSVVSVEAGDSLVQLQNQASKLLSHYDIIVTNPPYMSTQGMPNVGQLVGRPIWCWTYRFICTLCIDVLSWLPGGFGRRNDSLCVDVISSQQQLRQRIWSNWRFNL